ncbi:MAG: PAS domain-containing protein [Thiobacillus sp.]
MSPEQLLATELPHAAAGDAARAGGFLPALLAGFGFLLLLVTLVVGASVVYLGSLRAELETVVSSQLRRISQAHDLRMIIRERILSLDTIFLRDDPLDRDAAYMRFLELGSDFIAIRRRFEAEAGDAEERRILAAFRAQTIAATPPVEAVVELYLQGDLEAGRRQLLEVAIPAQARVIETSDTLHALYRERGEAAVAHAREVYAAASRTIIGLGAGVLLLTLLTAALVSRRVLRDRAALLAEIDVRRATEAKLRSLQEELESLVASRTARLQETAARLEEAQRVGQIGHWEWDITTGVLTWSTQVYRLFGLPAGLQTASYESFMAAVHPDDRDQVAKAVRHALAHGDYEIAHRIVRPDGEIRHVQERARVTFDPGGCAVRMIGTVQDITEAHRLQT